MTIHAYAVQDSITRLWVVKRGKKIIGVDLSKHDADNMVRILQGNDALNQRAKVNEYYRQSRGY